MKGDAACLIHLEDSCALHARGSAKHRSTAGAGRYFPIRVGSPGAELTPLRPFPLRPTRSVENINRS